MNELSFSLKDEFIELSKLLKVTGLCESGGDAKLAITQSLVRVNDEIETRKGRKIRAGFKVTYNDQTIFVK